MSHQSHRAPLKPNQQAQRPAVQTQIVARNESLESWDIRRARHALAQMPNRVDSEFVGTAKKLPMMIRTCGLAQAVAFYEAKGGTHCQIVASCGLWLVQSDNLQASTNGLAEALVDEKTSSPQKLRRCTSEVMAYLFWYIRFLDARK